MRRSKSDKEAFMSRKPRLNKPSCPKCSSFVVYFRRTFNSFACRTCGHVFEDKKKETKTAEKAA